MKGAAPSLIICLLGLAFSIGGAVGGWIVLHQEGAQLGVPKDREFIAGIMLMAIMGLISIVSFVNLIKCFKASSESRMSSRATSRSR